MKNALKIAAVTSLAAIALTACNTTGGGEKINKKRDRTDIKVGLICLHDENSTYDKNFIDSMNRAVENLGLADGQLIVKTGIAEDNAAKEAADDLCDKGCDIIFADSFGHEPFILESAKNHPSVDFCHSTGTQAGTAGVSNYHNAFASIYEGRFLAGVAAGYKLQELKKQKPSTPSKVGYVGAFTYAEVISGYTSWYLGVKSVVPDVTMEVQFTGSWYDEVAEKEAANKLIDNGAVVLSQHADSWGAPTACEERNVPDVSYNGTTYNACPNTYIAASKIDWTPYYEYAILARIQGKEIAANYTSTLVDGGVQVLEVGSAATSRTQAQVNFVAGQLKREEVDVFDCDTFTVTVDKTDANPLNWLNANAQVDGEEVPAGTKKSGKLTSYLADVEDFGDYIGDTEVVLDGAFRESLFRSAPYFDIQIDGITLLNTKF